MQGRIEDQALFDMKNRKGIIINSLHFCRYCGGT